MTEETKIEKDIKLFCVNLLVEEGFGLSDIKSYLSDTPFHFPPKKIERKYE